MIELENFFNVYGWQLGLIAFVGVVLLGVLKYANVFSKVEKSNRKPIYLAISVGFSLVATAIYLLIIGTFNIVYFLTIAGVIYALNQTFYAIYETTKLKDLVHKILNIIKTKLEDRKSEKDK